MARHLWTRTVAAGIVVAGSLVAAGTAWAQITGNGGLTGSIEGIAISDKNRPLNEAVVIVTSLDTPPRIKTQNVVTGPEVLADSTLGGAATGRDGYWKIDGIPAGKYKIEVVYTKNGAHLYGTLKEPVNVRVNDLSTTGELKLSALSDEEMKKATSAEAPDAAAVKAKNEKALKQQTALKAADTARDAGDFDGAIAKYGEVAGLIDNCGACYMRIGDIYLDKKKDQADAEKAYLKAVELNDAGAADDKSKAAPYLKLAGIYNDEQKFDEASKMSGKANDLLESSGGGDPKSVYNQGVSLWNAGKAPEAEAQFAKAVKLDPKMADAYYWLGMTQINQGKGPDAKTSFQTYLKLAPNGDNAATAKALLESIK